MAIKGKLSRRSFLSRVAGAAVTTGAMASITGAARSQEATIVDEDSSDVARNYTGLTDRDYGTNSDVAHYGRGTETGISDEDPADTAGFAERPRTFLTDADTGIKADRAGYGRVSRTGQSDADPTPNADRAGFGGQGGPGCSDSDMIPLEDPVGFGRSCGTETEEEAKPGLFLRPAQSPRR